MLMVMPTMMIKAMLDDSSLEWEICAVENSMTMPQLGMVLGSVPVPM